MRSGVDQFVSQFCLYPGSLFKQYDWMDQKIASTGVFIIEALARAWGREIFPLTGLVGLDKHYTPYSLSLASDACSVSTLFVAWDTFMLR
ncbi:MAG: hypothetical protein ABI045_06780 [Flavobacteriales bacterium]